MRRTVRRRRKAIREGGGGEVRGKGEARAGARKIKVEWSVGRKEWEDVKGEEGEGR